MSCMSNRRRSSTNRRAWPWLARLVTVESGTATVQKTPSGKGMIPGLKSNR
jgi:hypothetical protein